MRRPINLPRPNLLPWPASKWFPMDRKLRKSTQTFLLVVWKYPKLFQRRVWISLEISQATCETWLLAHLLAVILQVLSRIMQQIWFQQCLVLLLLLLLLLLRLLLLLLLLLLPPMAFPDSQLLLLAFVITML